MTSILNTIQNTLLLHHLRSYSPNVSYEILKSQLLLILKVLEKRPADILKTYRKDVRRVTSLGRPHGVNFDPLEQMHFNCIFFNFTSTNLFETIKSQLFYSFVFGETSYSRLIKVPKRRPVGDVLGTAPGLQFKT